VRVTTVTRKLHNGNFKTQAPHAHRSNVVRGVLKVLEVVLYTLEVANGVRRVLWVLGIILCMLFCILEVVEGELRLLEVLEMLEVICCVLLCMLEAVEGGLCLLEVPVPEVMCRVYSGGCRVGSVCRRCWR
jgi:hypothetical protein